MRGASSGQLRRVLILQHFVLLGDGREVGGETPTDGLFVGIFGAGNDALRIDDQTCVTMVYRLLREEGLFVGGSTGINVAAAVLIARRLGPGHVIVTLLCDRGSLYAARLFNKDWLAANGLDPGV